MTSTEGKGGNHAASSVTLSLITGSNNYILDFSVNLNQHDTTGALRIFKATNFRYHWGYNDNNGKVAVASLKKPWGIDKW